MGSGKSERRQKADWSTKGDLHYWWHVERKATQGLESVQTSYCNWTPGRLHELLGEEALNFNHLKYLVVDEADRMIEMGHFKEIDEILENIFQPKTKEFFDKDFEEASRMMDNKTKGA